MSNQGDMKIRGLLIDLDGTLYFQNRPYPGAARALSELRKAGYSLRFTTNTTAKTPEMIRQKLIGMGFDIAEGEVINATHACRIFLRSQPGVSCHLMVNESMEDYFSEFSLSSEDPDYVVIGDHGKRFTFESLNQAFLLLRGGAELIALQKGRFWFSQEGPVLDCGSFAALLEHATGKESKVTGKPSKTFFRLVLEDMNLNPEAALAIGDDLSTDIRGAHDMGMRSVLTKTGKFIPQQLSDSPIQPTWTLSAFADLPSLLFEM